MPGNLRGVFWLAVMAGNGNALVTFGAEGPSPDGGGVNTGVMDSSNTFELRVPGDRTWAWFDVEGTYTASNALDLHYKFSFDSGTNPTVGIITASTRFPGWAGNAFNRVFS